MSFDSDVALLGTGLAPLVAANCLLSEGKSVILLNPDWDFFREDSELPIDPLFPASRALLTPERLARSQPEQALAELKPHYPGSLELWPHGEGFHDPDAPHVRSRSRMWLSSSPDWPAIEDMYVEASDAGLKPQITEGIAALRRFPGYASRAPGPEQEEDARGVLMPKMCDVDVERYRNGLLEFVRERVAAERIVTAASSIELMPEGIRFHAQGAPRTARLREGLLIFWTPRVSQWLLALAKKLEAPVKGPRGVRYWEEWSLMSREKLDPGIVGAFEDMAVWAESEGSPERDPDALTRLSVLRAGKLSSADSVQLMNAPDLGRAWASSDSFAALSRLCHDFLKWDKFSVRSMRPRAIFEWENPRPWLLRDGQFKARVVCGCDGWLVDVVRAARLACAAGGRS
jgi:hypothetical protein